VTSPPALREICYWTVLNAMRTSSSGGKKGSLATALDSSRYLGLPEEIHNDLAANWRQRQSSLLPDASACTRLLPREPTAHADTSVDIRDPRRLVDSFFECRQCGQTHLPMDRRVNTLHHSHLDWLRRQAYRGRGFPQLPRARGPGGRLLAIATLSLLLASVCGTLAGVRFPRDRLIPSHSRRRRERTGACRSQHSNGHWHPLVAAQIAGGLLQRTWGTVSAWASVVVPSDPWTWAQAASMSLLSHLLAPGRGGGG